MNRLCKHVGLLLLAACLIGNLYADDSVFIGDGDISALKLYDSQGNRLDATSENASKIGEGWIIQNPDTPILIITPAEPSMSTKGPCWSPAISPANSPTSISSQERQPSIRMIWIAVF